MGGSREDVGIEKSPWCRRLACVCSAGEPPAPRGSSRGLDGSSSIMVSLRGGKGESAGGLSVVGVGGILLRGQLQHVEEAVPADQAVAVRIEAVAVDAEQ